MLSLPCPNCLLFAHADSAQCPCSQQRIHCCWRDRKGKLTKLCIPSILLANAGDACPLPLQVLVKYLTQQNAVALVDIMQQLPETAEAFFEFVKTKPLLSCSITAAVGGEGMGVSKVRCHATSQSELHPWRQLLDV